MGIVAPLSVEWPDDQSAPVILESDGQRANAALVAGNARGALLGIQSGIESAAIAQLGAWGQMPDGRYLTADFFPGAGRGRTALALYNGDLAAKYEQARVTSLVNTRSGDAGVLLRPDGVALGTGGAHIYCAWPASNGDIFFIAVEAGNFYHLFRCKAGTFTVGSDAGVTNQRAVLSLGMIGATQTDQCRIFTQRNFCEAKINGATHYFLAEYNVAAGRVDGGAKDVCRVYRSTDGGTTWATLLEFNGAGTHHVDHFHAVKQDPFTGWVYMLTGDSGNENAVIAYNGTAALPPANSTLATIAATAGWRVIFGNELHRYTDLFFSEFGIFSMPDADTEAAEASTRAYVGTAMPRTLEYVVSGYAVDRVDNVPPAIGLQSARSGDWFLCFCSSLAFPTYPYLDLFEADYKGASWTRVARLSLRAGGVPRAFFEDTAGRLWIYCDSALWLALESDYDGSSKTRSLVLTPGPRSAAVFQSTR